MYDNDLISWISMVNICQYFPQLGIKTPQNCQAPETDLRFVEMGPWWSIPLVPHVATEASHSYSTFVRSR